MEEKKLDLNSIIGFVLIFGILIWIMYTQAPTPEEIEAQKQAEQEQLAAEEQSEKPATEVKQTTAEDYSNDSAMDSVQQLAVMNKLGAFGYSATLPSAKDQLTTVETEVFELKFSNKGGHLAEVRLKEFVDYDEQPIYLVKDNNASFNLSFGTSDNRNLNTADLFFQPTVTQQSGNTVVSMKLKVSETAYLEYRYELRPKDYMIDFSIRSQGLNGVFNTSQPIDLEWAQKSFRNDKSISYENRYTRLTYLHDEDKIDKLAQMGDDEEVEQDVDWFSFRQHFFSSILVAEDSFQQVSMTSMDLVEDEEIDTVFTKMYTAKVPLEYSDGGLNSKLGLFYGSYRCKSPQAIRQGSGEEYSFWMGNIWVDQQGSVHTSFLLVERLPALRNCHHCHDHSGKACAFLCAVQTVFVPGQDAYSKTGIRCYQNQVQGQQIKGTAGDHGLTE
jgi:YidC/Oxa1 family membrane protein insertase